jgi:probable rRNA maturation factor
LAALSLAVQFDVAADPLPRRRTLRRWAAAAAERDLAVTLRFVGAREARALNARYRGRYYPTNVLTFVYDEVVPRAGDIVVCVPVVTREARAQGKTLRAHIAHLIVHGMLHLQGYDHERGVDAARMEARETALLARLGYDDPYASRDA